MPSPQVLVAGPVSWNRIVRLDVLPEPRPHTVFARGHTDTVGGTSAGKALNLADLGAGVTLSTVLGDDPEGGLARAALERDGISLLAETSAGGTEQHLNLMDGAGGRVSVYLSLPDPPARTRHDARLTAALQDCDVAVVDLAEHSRPLLERARAAGRPVWCDVHDYDGTAVLPPRLGGGGRRALLNDDGMADPLPFMRSRVAAGTSLVVCTQGSRGATAVTATGELHVPVRAGERRGRHQRRRGRVLLRVARGHPGRARTRRGDGGRAPAGRGLPPLPRPTRAPATGLTTYDGPGASAPGPSSCLWWCAQPVWRAARRAASSSLGDGASSAVRSLGSSARVPSISRQTPPMAMPKTPWPPWRRSMTSSLLVHS